MTSKHWLNLKANKIILIGSPRTGSYYVYDKLYDNTYKDFDEIFFCIDKKPREIIENRIQEFNNSSKCIAKLIPGQTTLDKNLLKKQCFKMCEMADNIFYTQRRNTLDQVLSYAVAVKQFNIEDVSPWKRNRKMFYEQIEDSDLEKAFITLEYYHNLVLEIYNKYPSKVFTLEDLEYKPYPNKYNYSGSWNVPYNFKMLEE